MEFETGFNFVEIKNGERKKHQQPTYAHTACRRKLQAKAFVLFTSILPADKIVLIKAARSIALLVGGNVKKHKI
jgi:hypothetical protein